MALKLGNFSLQRLKPANLYSAYFALSPREQTVALVVAAVLLVLIVVLPVTIASGRIAKLEKDVANGREQFKEIMRAMESYDTKRAELASVQQYVSAGYDSAISSTLESIAEANNIKERIDSLKEKSPVTGDLFDEMSVDVRLKKVTLQQVVDFLYAIEHHPDKVLRLKQLTMKTRFDNKQELDVSFTVSTYKLLEAAGEGA